MTEFLADISSFQHGLRIADLGDCVGVLAKCSEGTYYGDADYNGWRLQTAAAGKIFVAYDFVRADEDPDAQAAWIAAHIVDASLPLMLDVETEGTSKPSIGQVLALADRCRARGLRPKIAYIPYWYWQQIGSPDLTGLWSRGMGLISSAYPGGSGTAAQLYPGDSAAGWLSYGGMAPALYQFTDKASDGGQLLDMNAYRGTRDQLAAFLGTTSTTPGGQGMAYTVDISGWQRDYPDVAGALAQHIPSGTVVDAEHAAAMAMMRSFVAAERTATIEDLVRQLLARPSTQPVDVAALAAALAPHIAVTTDVGQLAADLIPHLPNGVDLQALADAIAATFGAKLSAQ